MSPEKPSGSESQANWPLQNLKSDEELNQHTMEELQALDVKHVYRGGEKTTDEDEKAARSAVQIATLEHLVQRFNLREKTNPSDTEQLIRMGKFHDFVYEYINSGRARYYEEIYQSAKLGVDALEYKMSDLFRKTYSEFTRVNGRPKTVSKGKEFRGKKVQALVEETGDKARREAGIPYGPKGPRSALGDAGTRTDKYRGEVSGGAPQ